MIEKGLGGKVAKHADEYNEKNGILFHGLGKLSWWTEKCIKYLQYGENVKFREKI